MTIRAQNQNNIYPFIRSYGRRRSHGLSESQKDAFQISSDKNILLSLPTEPQNPADFFANVSNLSKIFIEIGFGAGEHLIQSALSNSNIGFIGCEPFENGVAKTLNEILEKNLKNVKVFNGDARYFLELIKNSSVDRFYVLFPDPWTKRRHHKRKLLSEEFLSSMLCSKLKIGGEIIVATDCESYMEEILNNLKNIPAFSIPAFNLEQLKTRPVWLAQTRYEQKALSQGRQPFYLKIDKVA